MFQDFIILGAIPCCIVTMVERLETFYIISKHTVASFMNSAVVMYITRPYSKATISLTCICIGCHPTQDPSDRPIVLQWGVYIPNAQLGVWWRRIAMQYWTLLQLNPWCIAGELLQHHFSSQALYPSIWSTRYFEAIDRWKVQHDGWHSFHIPCGCVDKVWQAWDTINTLWCHLSMP